MLKLITYISVVFFVLACSDNATTQIYNKALVEEKIPCLKLVVFPPDELLENSLSQLYDFKKECGFILEVEKKSGITCNSTHNYERKAQGSFPSSYLKMQVKKGSILVYSYYIDLKESVQAKDVQSAFERVQKELGLTRSKQ